jgi:hypothetical protein
MPDLEEMAMEYAMLAPQNYDSETFSGDHIEAEQNRMLHKMHLHFRVYDVQQAIRAAEDTLKLVEFHPPEKNDE